MATTTDPPIEPQKCTCSLLPTTPHTAPPTGPLHAAHKRQSHLDAFASAALEEQTAVTRRTALQTSMATESADEAVAEAERARRIALVVYEDARKAFDAASRALVEAQEKMTAAKEGKVKAERGAGELRVLAELAKDAARRAKEDAERHRAEFMARAVAEEESERRRERARQESRSAWERYQEAIRGRKEEGERQGNSISAWEQYQKSIEARTGNLHRVPLKEESSAAQGQASSSKTAAPSGMDTVPTTQADAPTQTDTPEEDSSSSVEHTFSQPRSTRKSIGRHVRAQAAGAKAERKTLQSARYASSLSQAAPSSTQETPASSQKTPSASQITPAPETGSSKFIETPNMRNAKIALQKLDNIERNLASKPAPTLQKFCAVRTGNGEAAGEGSGSGAAGAPAPATQAPDVKAEKNIPTPSGPLTPLSPPSGDTIQVAPPITRSSKRPSSLSSNSVDIKAEEPAIKKPRGRPRKSAGPSLPGSVPPLSSQRTPKSKLNSELLQMINQANATFASSQPAPSTSASSSNTPKTPAPPPILHRTRSNSSLLTNLNSPSGPTLHLTRSNSKIETAAQILARQPIPPRELRGSDAMGERFGSGRYKVGK